MKQQSDTQIFLANRNICLQLDASHKIEIPIDSIKLVAEYTTDQGPFQDDWFLCVYYGVNEYVEFSMYTNGIQTMIAELAETLNANFFTTLHSSTDWHSNILYPAHLNGQILWRRVRKKRKSLGGMIKAIFGLYEYDLVLTNEANKIIKLGAE